MTMDFFGSLPEKHEDRMKVLQQWRDAQMRELDVEIAKWQEERLNMIREYDEKIEALNQERTVLGLGQTARTPVGSSPPTEIGKRVFEFLRKHAGEWFSAREIKEEIPNVGVMSNMLSYWIEAEIVQRQGSASGSQYCVPLQHAHAGPQASDIAPEPSGNDDGQTFKDAT